MTPEESALLQSLGILLIDGLSWLITLTMLYGAFALLFSISTGMMIRRRFKGLPQRIMFGVSFLTFFMASLHLASELSGPTILVRSGLVNNSDLPLEERPSIANQKAYIPNAIILWMTQLLPVISDAVVIWRAWVICTGQLWFIVPSIVLWTGAVACSLAYLAISSSPAGLHVTATNDPVTFLIIANLLSASIALSMATNAVATLVIGYKLYTHHQIVGGNLGRAKGSQATNVMALLVESGVLYCLLQIVTLILSFAPNPYAGPGSAQYIAAQIFFASYTEISAMYPTIVIVLVNLQRSFVDHYGIATITDTHAEDQDNCHEIRPATFGHLSFAIPIDEVHSVTSSSRISERIAGSMSSAHREAYEEKKEVA